MAKVRSELGIPPIGEDLKLKQEKILNAEQTVAVLEADDIQIWGRNGWSNGERTSYEEMLKSWSKGAKRGRNGKIRDKWATNNMTYTHAEGNVFWNLYKYRQEKGILDGKATLVVDRPFCRACGTNLGVQNLLEEVGLSELKVITPDHPQGIIFKPRPGRKRETWDILDYRVNKCEKKAVY